MHLKVHILLHSKIIMYYKIYLFKHLDCPNVCKGTIIVLTQLIIVVCLI